MALGECRGSATGIDVRDLAVVFARRAVAAEAGRRSVVEELETCSTRRTLSYGARIERRDRCVPVR